MWAIPVLNGNANIKIVIVMELDSNMCQLPIKTKW